MKLDLYGSLYRRTWQLRAGQFGREIFRRADEMSRRERLTANALKDFQLEQTQALLIHAYQQVPFHRARMEAVGFDPFKLTDLTQLERLPFMTKEELRAEGLHLVAQSYDPKSLLENASGGSTGMPVKFYQDQAYTIFNRANKLRQRRWFGYQMGDKIAYLWGARRDTRIKGFRHYLRQTLRREHWIDAFDLTSRHMLEFKNLLDTWQPELLVAYPSALQAFAAYLQNQGLAVRSPGAIECSAEKLQAAQRVVIEQVFNCPIYDVYGSREFGVIAAECEQHNGLHIFADAFYLEVIKDGHPAQPGELGEIVITCFGNFAMPFIRYTTGDLGVMATEPCACGRVLPRLAEVVGRTNGVISTPDGKLVHGAFFSKFFYDLPQVKRYRVHQIDRANLDILVESNGHFSPDQAAALANQIQTKLGESIKVSCRLVSNIEPLPSGKLAYLVSDVPLTFIQKELG